MAFPSYKEIEGPLLAYIYDNGGSINSSSCYEPLAEIFNLTKEEKAQLRADGSNRLHWNNRVQWARNSLVRKKYLHNSKVSGNGIWKLTENGIKEAEILADKRLVTYPDDVSETFFEGAVKQIWVNRYERSGTARDKCIDHYGVRCSVCNIDFEEVFGDIGKDFIHVHHITQVSEIGRAYELDPVRDLRPICPNCHSMVHRKTPPLSIEALRTILLK